MSFAARAVGRHVQAHTHIHIYLNNTNKSMQEHTHIHDSCNMSTHTYMTHVT